MLAAAGLRVQVARGGAAIVEDVALELRAGEILGLVGESGSGKTTTALALLGYARPGAQIAAGSVRIGGRELVGLRERELRDLRGRIVSYVPQDPSSSLNPSQRVGRQILEMLRGRQPDDVVADALRRVHLPADQAFARRFPHQLSGGQQQRVAIAMAIVGEPPLVVLDEPTTGLDVVTQAAILEEIRRLRREIGLAMVYVSHDLSVVGAIADRIAVMYAGRVVEQGPAADLLARPRHPYTRALVASIPDHVSPRRLRGIEGVAVGVGERPEGCAFAPRCSRRIDECTQALPALEAIGGERLVRCIRWRDTPPVVFEEALVAKADELPEQPLLVVEGLRAEHRSRGEVFVAATDVSFEIARAQCVALVGESGSGKTTVARCIAGLHAPAAGRVGFGGDALAPLAGGRTREQRRRIQIVFQNPDDSLNPRHRVGETIARPARVLRGLGASEARTEVLALLERVRLPQRLADRYPRELSGGERQRVAIARALAARPDLMVCDEVTSALDVSVQAAVLELLAELRSELGLALLFISHDLGVVASVADRVLVLDRGQVCEEGPALRLLHAPQAAYTRSLIEAAPRLPQAAS
ncbi:MAG: peptide/nickel transport system ATP-binding protein ddpF [Gaiellales bacterium]|nr:peptide/nickel transport system ATP-binding protein ddpF [Gaiellales bacterium]